MKISLSVAMARLTRLESKQNETRTILKAFLTV